jgi:membrane protease YdiL (CAAX protease family)
MNGRGTGSRMRPVRWVRRHPVGAFVLWFLTVGQALAFAPVIARAAGTDLPTQPFLVASTLLGLLLPAVVIIRVVDGPAGVRELWRRAVDFRAGLASYALAVLGVPLGATAIAGGLLGAPAAPAGEWGSLLVTGLVLPLVLTFLPNNWWEEVAWTGFVQERLQRRRAPAVAAVLTGLLFAAQHVSLAAGSDLASAAVLMALFTVLVIPFRFLTGWAYHRTGSLALVGLLHAMGNAVAGGSGFHPGLLARLYPGEQLASMAHLLAFFLVGLVVLVLTRGRLGRRPAPVPAAVGPALAAPAPLGPAPAAPASARAATAAASGATC